MLNSQKMMTVMHELNQPLTENEVGVKLSNQRCFLVCIIKLRNG